MKLPFLNDLNATGGDITKFNNLTKENSPNHSSMHHKPEGDYKLWAWPMWDMRLSVGVGVSKFVTGHFVIKAIIALGNVRYEWRLLLAGYTLHSLYWCLNSVRKREECPVSCPVSPPSSLFAAQTPAHKAAGIYNGQKEMTSSWSNSGLHSTVCSTVIILPRHSP